MVETTSGANAALTQALRQANDHMLQQQDFARAIKTFQEDLLQDLQKSSDKAHSYFSTLMKGVDSAMQTMMSKITFALQNVESSVVGLNQVGFFLYYVPWASLTSSRAFKLLMVKSLILKRMLAKYFSKFCKVVQSLPIARLGIGISIVVWRSSFRIHSKLSEAAKSMLYSVRLRVFMINWYVPGIDF